MGKIFKALEKKELEANDMDSEFSKETIHETIMGDPQIDATVSLEDPMPTLTPIADSIESLPGGIEKSLVTVSKPHSAEAEQFRLLKNNILFPEKGTPPRSIMITSPSPNEGKSFVASNLAISIAQSIDEHVLLMDCDLRSPTIHKLFDIPSPKGLSDHLLTGQPLSSVLKKTFLNKLTILPGGTIPKNPSELLSSGQMRRLIHEVKLRYTDRYIIVDTPPPYITSEGNALARQMDGIILVIRHGKTRKKDIQDIINIYGREKIIGVVHNFAERRLGQGYGYYKYGYGYGYGK